MYGIIEKSLNELAKNPLKENCKNDNNFLLLYPTSAVFSSTQHLMPICIYAFYVVTLFFFKLYISSQRFFSPYTEYIFTIKDFATDLNIF